MTPTSQLASLDKAALILRVQEAERIADGRLDAFVYVCKTLDKAAAAHRTALARASRAEMRLACWALADAFGLIGREIVNSPCANCGHLGAVHFDDGECGGDTGWCGPGCPCRAFVARVEGTL